MNESNAETCLRSYLEFRRRNVVDHMWWNGLLTVRIHQNVCLDDMIVLVLVLVLVPVPVLLLVLFHVHVLVLVLVRPLNLFLIGQGHERRRFLIGQKPNIAYFS